MKLLQKLATVADVEVVVALLPEVLIAFKEEARDPLLQGFESLRQGFMLRFTKKQVNMFGHDYVAVDAQCVTTPDTFYRDFECSLRLRREKTRLPVIAAERNEMGLSGLVVTLQSPWHRCTL